MADPGFPKGVQTPEISGITCYFAKVLPKRLKMKKNTSVSMAGQPKV